MSADASANPQTASREGLARLIAGYVAIAFILPYLALKIAWISGVPVGMLDKSRVADPGMIALNIVTLCMSFVGQGLALVTAFILYVRVRWGDLLHVRTGDGQPPRRTIVLLGNAASAVAASVGVLHLLWAAGARVGLPPHFLQEGGANSVVFQATSGLAALGAATGLVILVNRFGRSRLWLPTSLAWIGAGTMFSWGAWLVLATVLKRNEGAWLFTTTNVIKTAAGVGIGVIGLRVVTAAGRH